MRHGQNWPERLWLVRHGQSQGNVARDAAHEAGLQRHRPRPARRRRAAVRPRPPAGRGDRPLVRRAARGRAARGHHLLALYPRRRPPRRSAMPAGLAGGAKPSILDERLREREFGVFDGLTTHGHPRTISRGSRAPRQARQILPPRRPAARAGPTSSCGSAACSTPSTSTMPTGACWSSATRWWCCACATSWRS